MLERILSGREDSTELCRLRGESELVKNSDTRDNE